MTTFNTKTMTTLALELSIQVKERRLHGNL
jgi:hypothetical protein